MRIMAQAMGCRTAKKNKRLTTTVRERDDPFRTCSLGKRCACIAFLPLCSRDGGSPDWILAFAGTQAGRYVFEGDNHPRESYSRNACTRAFSLSGIKPSSTAQKPPTAFCPALA